MSGITLAQAQAQLDLWVAADAAVAAGQSYSIGGRSLTRVNAAEITNKIDYWMRRVAEIQRGGAGRVRVRYGVPNA